jgi:hypothetical protein
MGVVLSVEAAFVQVAKSVMSQQCPQVLLSLGHMGWGERLGLRQVGPSAPGNRAGAMFDW